MPAVVTQLVFETPGGVSATCVGTQPELRQGRLVDAYKDAGAVVVNGNIETIEALPKAQIVVSRYGFQ